MTKNKATINKVITRFAPSPTGELHIGGARTALFNWLWAKHTGGKFILRIEDTDQKRNKEQAVNNIIRDLQWLGLDWDEEYTQSYRLDIYNNYIDDLLNKNTAYIKPDTKAVFLSFSKKEIIIQDTIIGEVKFNTNNIKNFVIRKSNGFPTYSFACVIDDYLMGITHVIRGQEHLNNCAPQQIIRDALEINTTPEYSHVSVILNMNGSKMSKRDDNTDINVIDFRHSKISPCALLNFIALLGWSPGGNKEIMSIDELIKLFTLNRLRKSNSKFDRQKLLFFNKKHKA